MAKQLKKYLEKLKKRMSDTNKEELTDETQNIEQDQVENTEATTENEADDLAIQLAEAKDKYLRLFAEFDNFKKRTMKEKLETIKSASQDTLSALLPVLDDFDRAKKSSDAEDSTETFSEGVTMVYNKIYTILKGRGLEKMESTGLEFDPELHEAITKIPAPSDDMKGKIIDTVESGYTLNEKIIRHAKVVVGE